MTLRLIDRHTGEVLETWPRGIRTEAAADNIIRKRVRWAGRLGGLGNAKLHIQAELLDGVTVLRRWVWMETLSVRMYYGPHGDVIQKITESAAMRWVACADLESSDHLACLEPSLGVEVTL